MTDDHVVRIEFDDGPNYAMTCNAPPDAMCHARYDCECEAWIDAGVTDGLPTHKVGWDVEDDDTRHVGRFDPTWCNYVEWFDADDGELNITGAVAVPVTPEWQGECYTYAIADPRTTA